MRLNILTALTLGLIVSALPASACYSGLVLIPTADVVGANTYSLDAQLDGPLSTLAADTYFLNTEIGIGNRFETGLDFDMQKDADTDVFVNAKYVFMTERKERGAMAAGVCSIADEVESSPYVVYTRNICPFRGHLGIMHTGDTNNYFVGADTAIGEKFSIMGDYISGDGNAASAGVAYSFNDKLCLLAGLIFPNDGSDTRFSLHLTFSDLYRKESE